MPGRRTSPVGGLDLACGGSEDKVIVAVDPGRMAGVAIFRGRSALAALEIQGGDEVVALSVMDGLVAKLGLPRVDVVVVEHWTFSRNLDTVMALAGVQRVWFDAGERRGADRYRVNSQSWQSAFGLASASKKTDTRKTRSAEIAGRALGCDPALLTENQSDAVCIGLYAASCIAAGASPGHEIPRRAPTRNRSPIQRIAARPGVPDLSDLLVA